MRKCHQWGKDLPFLPFKHHLFFPCFILLLLLPFLSNVFVHGSPTKFDTNDLYENDISFDDLLNKPPTPEELQKIERFDPSRLNYTAVRIAIDQWLNRFQRRSGKMLGMGPTNIPGFLSTLGKVFDMEQVVKEVETSIMTSVSCNACKGGMGLLQHYIQTGKARDEFIYAASRVCSSLKIETPRVCHGIIRLMADEVIYVASNVYMTPQEVCGFIIGDVCGYPFNPYHEWWVTFPPVPKPPLRPTYYYSDSPVMKVLQLSDTHFDPDYQYGSNANCGEPLCCRATSPKPKKRSDMAGYWGDFRECDTPLRTILSMLEHIAHTHTDIDYIIWTGDLPPHDIWNQTKESNIHVLRETVNQLLTFFPNTPIFPALGNHESAPVNSFPPSYVPDYFSVAWLYNELNVQWQHWLPQDTSATILKGGFYSVLIKPKFRIISLNTNFCNNKNWWLLVNSTDPAQELQWLIYELQGAEMRNERVHIIGHIPPGHNDCLKVWSHNYYNIVNRYESTITAQFFGHTHYDEFELFYDDHDRRRATNIAYIGPSVTSYYGLNPGYRIYTIEGDYEHSNRMVVDHETWIMDLKRANKNGIPHWFQLYSARSAYQMKNLNPQLWDQLIHRMTDDDNLFKMYYRFYWKSSPVREKCDKDCKKRLLCDLKSGRSHDKKVTCSNIKEQIEAQDRKGWGGWIYSGLSMGINFYRSLASWFVFG